MAHIQPVRSIWFICTHCGNAFLRQRHVESRQFCSRKCQYAAKTARQHIHFWKFVDKRGADECWEWQGASKHERGFRYGRFFVAKQKAVGAHRYAFMLANGPIPDGLHVLHICDNPPCVNPAHLRLGTQRDNMQDRKQKGRDPAVIHDYSGTRNPNAKLSESDIQRILEMRRTGMTYTAISKLFPVCMATIFWHCKKHLSQSPQ